jgi:iron(III) transport system ATP-binding protein
VSTITCRQITKSFGDTRVLDDLDLDVPDGAVVTLLGESGSGKTTLLRLIAGFERPDTGTIAIDGEVVDAPQRFVPPERRRVGFVAQEGNLFPHLTVARNIAFGLPRADRASGRNSGRVDEMLQLVGLDGLGKRYPHELSGGQQQRIALARALAPRPRLVLLDEPFSSLDAGLRASLRRDVMEILRARRATTVFVTHDQSEALSVADLVGLIDHGRIRQFAAPDALYDRPRDPAVAQFLGEANIMPGAAADGDVDTVLGRLHLSDEDRAQRGPVAVLVRPEQLRIVAEAATDGGRTFVGTSGTVAHREYYGHDSVVLVRLDGSDVTMRVRCPGAARLALGDRVALAVDGDVIAWPAGEAG